MTFFTSRSAGIHALRKDSGAPARMLLLFAPAAPRQAYCEGLVEAAAAGRTFSDEECTEFLHRHDQHMV